MQFKLLTAPAILNISRENKIIVFTNGCFDLLHEGHKQLLREAKKLGDILIVGLNADVSVKKLKGENRPIENEILRVEKLSELPEVDHVILFDEETPSLLIEILRPDVLVKGGDYTEATIAGADFVRAHDGKVVIIPLLEDYSTTKSLENND